jgi:hypothetical protein
VFLLGWLMVENGLGSETIEMCIGLFSFPFFSLPPWVFDGSVLSFFLFSYCHWGGFFFGSFFSLFLSCFSSLKWMTRISPNITQTNHHL